MTPTTTVAESFFGALQLALLDRHDWQSRDQLAAALFEWIECFYNPTRRHTSIGSLAPVEFERASTRDRPHEHE